MHANALDQFIGADGQGEDGGCSPDGRALCVGRCGVPGGCLPPAPATATPTPTPTPITTTQNDHSNNHDNITSPFAILKAYETGKYEDDSSSGSSGSSISSVSVGGTSLDKKSSNNTSTHTNTNANANTNTNSNTTTNTTTNHIIYTTTNNNDAV